MKEEEAKWVAVAYNISPPCAAVLYGEPALTRRSWRSHSVGQGLDARAVVIVIPKLLPVGSMFRLSVSALRRPRIGSSRRRGTLS